MWSQVLFHITPAVVFVLTALVAIIRFNLFRSAKPSIKVELAVSSRSASENWTAISAIASVTNTSQVIAKCDALMWEVRVLAPFDDEAVESKVEEYSAYFTTDGPPVEFPWNVQYLVRNNNPGIALEPGETNVVDLSLAIPGWITSIDVRCSLVLPKGSRGQPYLWTNRVPHDINTEEPDA